jgi:hypothetical protein
VSGRNAALAVEDASDPVDGDLDPARELRRGQADRCELLGKVFARMNGAAGHKGALILQ